MVCVVRATCMCVLCVCDLRGVCMSSVFVACGRVCGGHVRCVCALFKCDVLVVCVSRAWLVSCVCMCVPAVSVCRVRVYCALRVFVLGGRLCALCAS